jgi:hypothetical protein
MFVEELADLGEFFGGGAFGGEGLENEVGGGAGEGAVDEVFDDLALGVMGGEGGGVDVGAVGFVALDEPFFHHDLEELEGGGVTGFAGEVFVDLSDGGGAVVPEDAEEGEFAVGGSWWGRWFGHSGFLRKREWRQDIRMFS